MRVMIASIGTAGLAVAVATANLALYKSPVDVSPLTISRQTPRSAVSGNQDSLPPVGGVDFSETFERPLFNPTRRKFVPVPVEEPPVAIAVATVDVPPEPETAPMPPPTLLGISVAGATRKVLLRGENQDAQWRQSGETTAGWTIADIEPDRVILNRNSQTMRILLYPQSPDHPAGEANRAN